MEALKIQKLKIQKKSVSFHSICTRLYQNESDDKLNLSSFSPKLYQNESDDKLNLLNYISLSPRLYQNISDDKTKKIQYIKNLIEISKLSYAYVYGKEYIAPIDKIEEIRGTDKTNSTLLLEEFINSNLWYGVKILASITPRFGLVPSYIVNNYQIFKNYMKHHPFSKDLVLSIIEALKIKNKTDKNKFDVGFPEYLAEQSALPSPEVLKYFRSNNDKPISGPILTPSQFQKMGDEFANYRTKNIHLLLAFLQIPEKPGYIEVIEILTNFLYKSFVYSIIRYVTGKIYHYGFYVLKKLLYIFYTKWFGK